jgi:uncharacterized protein YqjF (DUF2071 family)
MKSPGDKFLTAEWRHLAMLNYDIDPSVLVPLVPAGTELDQHAGRTMVSLVGFLFLNTRVLGIPIPLHRNFEEVNLRFYVRRKADDGWRRAVVFVKELVPRFAIAVTAKALYGENYAAVPMSHAIVEEPGRSGDNCKRVSYDWRFKGRTNWLRLTAHGEPLEVEAGSEAEFITEHYWGYARRANGSTTEYRVDHPRWRVRSADDAQFVGDVGELYGKEFVPALQGPPDSAFLAEGSEVTVFKGSALRIGAAAAPSGPKVLSRTQEEQRG